MSHIHYAAGRFIGTDCFLMTLEKVTYTFSRCLTLVVGKGVGMCCWHGGSRLCLDGGRSRRRRDSADDAGR